MIINVLHMENTCFYFVSTFSGSLMCANWMQRLPNISLFQSIKLFFCWNFCFCFSLQSLLLLWWWWRWWWWCIFFVNIWMYCASITRYIFHTQKYHYRFGWCFCFIYSMALLLLLFGHIVKRVNIYFSC